MLPIPVNMMLTQSIRSFGAGYLCSGRRELLRSSVSTVEIADLEMMLISSQTIRQTPHLPKYDVIASQPIIPDTRIFQEYKCRATCHKSMRNTADLQSAIESVIHADYF